MRKRIALTLGILTLMATAGTAAANSYNSKECKEAINEIYSNIDIGKLTLKSESFLPIYGGFSDSATIRGYETWFSFNECRGNLVVHVSKTCGYATVYTTTECEIEGIPHY